MEAHWDEKIFPGSISHKSLMLGLKLTTADPQSSLFPECPLSLGTALFLDLTIAYPFSFPTSFYGNQEAVWRCCLAQYWEDGGNTSCDSDIQRWVCVFMQISFCSTLSLSVTPAWTNSAETNVPMSVLVLRGKGLVFSCKCHNWIQMQMRPVLVLWGWASTLQNIKTIG